MTGLCIPADDIIGFSDFSALGKSRRKLLVLLLVHHHAPHERRVAHDVRQLSFRHDALPVHAQGVALDDVGIRFQRQEIELHQNDALGLLHHLTLRYPQRRLRNGHGKVVYLYAVKLPDGDLDGIPARIAENYLIVLQLAQNVVFYPAQADIGLGQEVARAAGGVEKRKSCELLLKGLQPVLSRFRNGDGAYIVKL